MAIERTAAMDRERGMPNIQALTSPVAQEEGRWGRRALTAVSVLRKGSRGQIRDRSELRPHLLE
eukprot:8566711-Pyramimonas_sp.AAC.1